MVNFHVYNEYQNLQYHLTPTPFFLWLNTPFAFTNNQTRQCYIRRIILSYHQLVTTRPNSIVPEPMHEGGYAVTEHLLNSDFFVAAIALK